MSGLTLGIVAGMLLFDSRRDIKRVVEKGKDIVSDKVDHIKSKVNN